MVSAGFGWSRQGRRRVRITNTTSVCVAMDSRNQPVRNTSGLVWNIRKRTPKVRKSKTEESGPITPAKRTTCRMLQRCGLAMSAGPTASNGMPISEMS